MMPFQQYRLNRSIYRRMVVKLQMGMEWERIWQEAGVAYFSTLFQLIPWMDRGQPWKRQPGQSVFRPRFENGTTRKRSMFPTNKAVTSGFYIGTDITALWQEVSGLCLGLEGGFADVLKRGLSPLNCCEHRPLSVHKAIKESNLWLLNIKWINRNFNRLSFLWQA